jgi:hypothetical protein
MPPAIPASAGSAVRNLRGRRSGRGAAQEWTQAEASGTAVPLLEHPGEVVTREELRSRLWPADTFGDFDHDVNAAVKRLRDSLGDDPDNPRFVETLARRGYRFIGNIGIPAATPSARLRPWKWLSTTRNAAVVGLVVGALVLSFLLYRHSIRPKAAPATVTAAVTNVGEKYSSFA